jgi:ABC-type branched-subunit amino acid transport system substrate-binding protein
LVTEDDQSTPTGSQTAVQRLLADNVTYIVNGSPYFFESDKAVQQAGVPVIGQLTDGPEWGQQPFTNMFDLRGGVNPTYTGVADITGATFFKKIGVKKLAALALGISPSAVATAKVTADAATHDGIDMAFENLNVPYGPYEPTTDILQMKSAGAQGVYCVCGASTYASLITGLRNDAVKVHPLSFGGVDYTLFNSPTTADAVQGIYYNSYFPPENANAASQTAEQEMAKTVPGYKLGQVPTYSVAGTYNAGQLALKGLQMTGQKDPTKAEIIAKLQTLKNWNADGLLPSSISFTHFGTSETKYCAWFVQGDTKTKTFNYVFGGKPLCENTPAAYIG